MLATYASDVAGRLVRKIAHMTKVQGISCLIGTFM